MKDLPNCIQEIMLERDRQDAKWGEQNHPNGSYDDAGFYLGLVRKTARWEEDHDGITWATILHEEFMEAMEALGSENLRDELVQVAAVAVAWLEALDRRSRDCRADHEPCGGGPR